VIPAMIRKFLAAKESGTSEVVLWGDGSPTREFLYVEDCAQALLLAAERYDSSDPVNIGSGVEMSIRDLTSQVAAAAGYAGRIEHLYRDPHESDARVRLHYGDLNDSSSLQAILRSVQPDEVYNLAAQSHVRVSFDIPEYTSEITGLGSIRLLEAIRQVGIM